eukprot:6211245-Pleurochrysis_carterae.AAC.2
MRGEVASDRQTSEALVDFELKQLRSAAPNVAEAGADAVEPPSLLSADMRREAERVRNHHLSMQRT